LKLTDNTLWSKKKNSTFKLLTFWIEDTLGKEKYLKMKERLCKLKDIHWDEE
jgi:hypothetical protein